MQKISRIDQIGLNGNDGLHYDAKEECKHVWIIYSGIKKKYCQDCKILVSTKDDYDLTSHKRKSTI